MLGPGGRDGAASLARPVTPAPPTAGPALDDSRAACGPCRGTGAVVSNLGAEPATVPCPWCEGSGTFLAGHDAQAARRAAAGSP